MFRSVNKVWFQVERTSEKVDIKYLVDNRPKIWPSIRSFISCSAYALKLIFLEKEIIVFSILQWLTISAMYFVFIEILSLIPEAYWLNPDPNSYSKIMFNVVALIWLIICIAIAAYPLSILSGCIGSAHFSHEMGQRSSVATCLEMSARRSWPLWVLAWVDGYYTVMQILDRLPRKNDRRDWHEMLYMAWKIIALGVMPGLLVGKSVKDACKDSLILAKDKFKEVVMLRIGYSALCWVVGVLAYLGGLFYLMYLDIVNQDISQTSKIAQAYTKCGLPVFIAVGFVQVFFRPIYLILTCQIYSEFMKERNEVFKLAKHHLKSIYFFCGASHFHNSAVHL